MAALNSRNQEIFNAYSVIPKKEFESYILIESYQSLEEGTISELELLVGKKIEIELVDKEYFDSKISKEYRGSPPNFNPKTTGRFVEDLIEDAEKLNASDIHIEPLKNHGRIRYRLDGKLFERFNLESELLPSIINKVKISAGMDIVQKRIPQDGRIAFKNKSIEIDIRVSSIPLQEKQKLVLRLLRKDFNKHSFQDLGMDQKTISHFEECLQAQQGLILISGPTGSGKSTTLNVALKRLNNPESNILTIEDPIEYSLDGISKVQVNEKAGLTFPVGLRAFLRQDPDVIMVGEIRDQETAEMAIRAGLTGHLVLSTLHTNSAWGIVDRLTDLEIPPYLISSTTNLLVAQRLIRLLCNNCKNQEKANEYQIRLDFKPYEPLGCEKCNFSGYKGRRAIYDSIKITSELRDRIRNTNKPQNNKDPKIQDGLKIQGMELLRTGETSISEVLHLLH